MQNSLQRLKEKILDKNARGALERLKETIHKSIIKEYPDGESATVARDAIILFDHYAMKLDGFFEDIHEIALEARAASLRGNVNR